MESWKREARPDAWEESVSTGCLYKPTMNARDQARIQKIFQVGEGGSELPTLNFNKQKKKGKGVGGFSFGVKQVFILCDCLFVPLYLFDFNIASEHCVKNREGGGLGVLPKKKIE